MMIHQDHFYNINDEALEPLSNVMIPSFILIGIIGGNTQESEIIRANISSNFNICTHTRDLEYYRFNR